ncbi:hypothetical protein G7Z17_g3659 [Cylindrodendrum hubeiense]|uniref:Methyltransferase n=1 Tax=Cylindrodendrum hubeiense TaxID=595255 RepID=A0A9P5LDC0_9HYPO|nr:hypothetical protein G7Z17_g3659 [Cylindrodendrum hubeiense]
MAEQTVQERSQSPQEAVAQLQDLLAENPLQADDDLDENDSAFDDSESAASEMTSLNSSVLNYKYEPNDDEEQERMDLGHHIYRLVLGGKLNLAPISKNPQRVLDLGTGTGIWAIDFADEYPSAEVLGTDLSPIQPKWTPPNCSFEVDDFESEWVYHTPFDFIHARELGGCISDDNRLFKQAFQHLAPGGYFEIQAVHPDFVSDDDTADKATNAQLWMKNMREGAARFGKPLDSALLWQEKLKSAGFVDVQQSVLKVRNSQIIWLEDAKLKEIGKFQSIQEKHVIDSYTPGIFGRVLGWSEEEIQVFVAKVKSDLKNPSIHLYTPVYFIWGRKPLSNE